MIGKITKIHEPQQTPGGHYFFQRINFKMIRDDGSTYWAKTDLCPSFRNWKNWKDLLKIGNTLGGLEMKNSTTIDADCPVRFISSEEVFQTKKKEEQQTLL